MMFYVLRQVLDNPHYTEAESIGLKKLGEAPKCPICGRHLGMRAWLPPYRIRLASRGGEELGDLAFANLGMANLFVSSRFRRCCEDAGITGVEFSPLDVVKVRLQGKESGLGADSYYHINVRRGRAAIDVERSGVEFPFVDCPECRSLRQFVRTKRIVLEDATWDGLDVFRPRGLTSHILVSDRFEEMSRACELRNVICVESRNYSLDTMPWLQA